MYNYAYLNDVNYTSLKRSDHLQLLREKDEKIRYLSFELEQFKRALFGSKSERFVHIDNTEQLELFAALQKQLVELQEEQITYTRKKVKRKPKRTKLPAHLERVVQVIEPEVDLSDMQKIGEEIQEKLAIIPAKVYVDKIVRPKYKDDQGVFHIATLPPDPFPKSIASPSLAAQLAVSKYVDHQPLYRQSQIFKRNDIDVPRSTMYGIIRKGAELLRPLHEVMIDLAMNSNYLMADESSIPVLHANMEKPSRGAC